MIKGIPVSKGIVFGHAHVEEREENFSISRRKLNENEIKTELDKFEAAVRSVERSLGSLEKAVAKKIGKREAKIFSAQILVLNDPMFREEILFQISSNHLNVEAALVDSMTKFSKMLSSIEDVYLKERASDLRDVGRRVLAVLMKQPSKENLRFEEDTIIVRDEISPSATANMELQGVVGFVTEHGSSFTHMAILARSLGIPAVVSVKDATVKIKTGDSLILDGIAGTIFVNPSQNIIEEYKKNQSDLKAYRESLKGLVDVPCATRDGVRIKLCGNIGKVADAEAVRLLKADGVGLYRTEFLYMIQDHFPTEEEQYHFYNQAVESMHPQEVVIRVLDLGSDKELPYFPVPKEENPALGQRGIRFLLKYQNIFKTQLRAILRVNALYPLSILLPMIGSVDEIIKTKTLIENERAFLIKNGLTFDKPLRIGAMIEVPSVVFQIGRIVKEVDFLSIGTNDLIQYTLAADRFSQDMHDYYEAVHPSILSIIRMVVESAEIHQKEVSICGEIASDIKLTKLLLGLGLKSFSVVPGGLLEVKKTILATSFDEAKVSANEILKLETTEGIKTYLDEHSQK